MTFVYVFLGLEYAKTRISHKNPKYPKKSIDSGIFRVFLHEI